ncbi:hypothetical protein ACLB1E_16105 [Escherichia coli]
MYSSSTRRACSSSLPLIFRLQLSLNQVPVPISASELLASAFVLAMVNKSDFALPLAALFFKFPRRTSMSDR